MSCIQQSLAKETYSFETYSFVSYNFKDPTNRSHPTSAMSLIASVDKRLVFSHVETHAMSFIDMAFVKCHVIH